jgi:hypothetical protein
VVAETKLSEESGVIAGSEVPTVRGAQREMATIGYEQPVPQF